LGYYYEPSLSAITTISNSGVTQILVVITTSITVIDGILLHSYGSGDSYDVNIHRTMVI
jgi:hypothetical protein